MDEVMFLGHYEDEMINVAVVVLLVVVGMVMLLVGNDFNGARWLGVLSLLFLMVTGSSSKYNEVVVIVLGIITVMDVCQVEECRRNRGEFEPSGVHVAWIHGL